MKKKTAYVGFRVEEEILEQFDAKVAELGIKRQVILRNFMRAFVGAYRENIMEAMAVMEQMNRLDGLKALTSEFREKLEEKLREVMTFELGGDSEEDFDD